MKRLLWAIPFVLVLGLWSSSSPDGLEGLAIRLGIAPGPPEGFCGTLPDYWIVRSRLGRFLAGLLGCLLVSALALGLQRLARARRATSTPPTAPPRR